MTEFDVPDRLRDHAYDGIQEFDNRLPNWWLWSFYLACLFSVAYWFHFHVLRTGALPTLEYQREMESAAEQLAQAMAGMEVDSEFLHKLANEPAAVQKGRAIFIANCATCHKEDGGGNVGPNLTDKYWLHGANPKDLYRIVTKGVADKGMVAWESILGPTRCQQVVAYTLTLKNSNVAGGKEPQGAPEN